MAVLSKVVLFCVFFMLFISFSTLQANEVKELPGYSMKYSTKSTASKAQIWSLWEDVENWKKFDERLQYSYLVDNQGFKEGAVGYLKAKNAPKTQFVVTDFQDSVSFTQILKLPFYQTIELKRYFEKDEGNEIIFTHEVIFKGRLRSVAYAILCSAFKKDLKLVVDHIKFLAEEKIALSEVHR